MFLLLLPIFVAQDVNAHCSLSISEAQLGAKTCKDTDTEVTLCKDILDA